MAKKKVRKSTPVFPLDCPAPGCRRELDDKDQSKLPRLDLKSTSGLQLSIVFCTKACLKRWWDEWVTQKTHSCIRHVGWG